MKKKTITDFHLLIQVFPKNDKRVSAEHQTYTSTTTILESNNNQKNWEKKLDVKKNLI